MIRSWRDDPRRETNPVFNANRLKLGVFAHNGTGSIATTAPDAMMLTWPSSLAVSQAADRAGLETIVPYARWKGYLPHKPNHRSGVVFDTYTWAAGIAQGTKDSGVFCTSHVPTIHPLLAAKQCATIDHISAGRFGLNVVAGWNKLELDMFGAPMKAHDDRYDQAAEWIEILTKLWTQDDDFDYEGKYYSLRKAVSLPKPLQKPFPPIMNAGGSGKGKHFAAKYADMAFVILKSNDIEGWRSEIDAYRRLARDEYGRDIQVWSFASIVQRDSQAEADEFLAYYSQRYRDEEALDAFMELQGMHTQLFAPDQLEAMKKIFGSGGGFPLFGTAAKIVASLEALSQAGLDGILLTWFDYEDGLRRWLRDVIPLMEQAGLRLPRRYTA